MELNIESDLLPFDDRNPTLRIPSAFFVDPRLAVSDVSIRRQDYDTALEQLQSRLWPPKETGLPAERTDADHGWLAPVKAHSDIIAVNSLIEEQIISEEFAIAVLTVDFTNPALSGKRCSLLKLVPPKGGADFVARFKEELQKALAKPSPPPGTAELLNALSNPAETAARAKQQAEKFMAHCKQKATDPAAVLGWYRLLAQRRVEVSKAEISQNPQGRILEDPGRIVFPSTTPKAEAGQLSLSVECEAH
jgi:hypothetical protein